MNVKGCLRALAWPGLSQMEQHALLVLLIRAPRTTMTVRRSVAGIARDMNCHPTAARRALHGLVDKGLVKSTAPCGKSTSWTVLVLAESENTSSGELDDLSLSARTERDCKATAKKAPPAAATPKGRRAAVENQPVPGHAPGDYFAPGSGWIRAVETDDATPPVTRPDFAAARASLRGAP